MQVLLITFAIAVGIQIIYFLVFLLSLKRKGRQHGASITPVSIVVAAHDEEANLQELIPLLLNQDYPSFEIIIVNDRSNDNTYDYVLNQTIANEKIKLIDIDRTPPHLNSKKYALTLGIKAARNEWILFTDADCRPHTPNWIKAMAGHFQPDYSFVLGFSPYFKRKGLLNLFIRFEGLLTALQYFSFAQRANPYMGVGRNLAYRRSLFLEMKGFNQIAGVMGGDDDLFVNLHATARNTTVCIDPEAKVYSIPKTSWPSFFNQKIRHISVGKYYKTKHKVLLGLFMLSWIVTWLSGISLLFLVPYVKLVAIVLAFRLLFWSLTIHILSRRLDEPFNVWAVPFLDFIFVFYYISIALGSLMTKDIKWKN